MIEEKRAALKKKIGESELKKKIDESETLEKGKKGVFGVIYGRTVVVLLLLLIQILMLFLAYKYLQDKGVILNGVLRVLSIFLTIHIINRRENPAFMIYWIILILGWPVFGSLLYLFVEMQPAAHWINKRLNKMHVETKHYWTQDAQVAKNLSNESSEMPHLSTYVYEKGGFPTWQNTTAQYFPDGQAKFKELLKQLEKAEHFIFLEYFIVAKGYMWDTVLEVLKRKAAEGVEVRFMYDGTCSFTLLPYHYPRQLEEMGIHCHMFAPVIPALSTHQNNRDHRKIVVIDGKVAFTGGINLADEYIGEKIRFGTWKDTAIMLEGDAVRSFTLMFLEMWNVDKKWEKESFDKYLQADRMIHPEADGFVIPYGDSPLDNEPVGENVYMDILYTAKEYVHIMTPYLILDHDMTRALTYAAKRGVEVIIIMPHIPDKKYAFLLAKTYYGELLDAGVQIYEFTEGFVHAKVFTSDDRKAVVGTINLDFRSLYLHFECAVYLYRNAAIPSVEEDFQETLKRCQKVTPEEVANRPVKERLAGQILRLVAPLM